MTDDQNRPAEAPATCQSASTRGGGYSDGFVVAALGAPVIAFAVFVGAAVVTHSAGGEPVSVGQSAVTILLLLVAVFVTGAVPSLLFGGAVLALIRTMRLSRSRLVCAIGGGAAATLYVVASMGVAFVLPMAALLFAPWTALHTTGRPADFATYVADGLFWVPISILVSGVLAGLIYERLIQKG